VSVQATSTQFSDASPQLLIGLVLLCVYFGVQFGEGKSPHRQDLRRVIILPSRQRRP